MKADKNALQEINIQCADIIDWTTNCFPLGVKIEGRDSPWLELDEEDLLLLNKVLTIPLLVPAPDGGVTGLAPLAARSESLMKMAAWAKAAASWMRERDRKAHNPCLTNK